MSSTSPNLSGQEQYDGNAASESPASEAGESSNDSKVVLEGPPPSGAGGVYPTLEIPSSIAADSRGNILGPDYCAPSSYDSDS